jgi:hypothetical protein
MNTGRADLEVGDHIEIKYRAPRNLGDDLADRWIAAEIIHSDAGELPVARLTDGQLTDIRKFMTWRRLSRAQP